MRISLAQFEHARELLRERFAPTRLVASRSVPATSNQEPGTSHQPELFLKVETELPTGTFKVRGAVYALSANVQRRQIDQVIAASTGNHGAAVAYAAGLLKIPATIFVPERSNAAKLARIRELGGRIVEIGSDLSLTIDAAYECAERSGAFFLHDAADPDVPVGAGTIGLEILEQMPSADAIYVPMGDTALIRGVAEAAKHLKPSIRIIGAVAERAPAYYLSWQQRAAVETAAPDTIADGLAVRRTLRSNVEDICALVDDVQPVTEDEMVDAIRRLATHDQLIAEPAGAAATAAYLKDSTRARTSVALVTGANIAPDLRAQILGG
jgi:threonine dehydratase